MRTLFAFALVFLAVGVIWLGQGVGLIGGSFMSGQAVWAVIGGLFIVISAFLFRTGRRWRKVPSAEETD